MYLMHKYRKRLKSSKASYSIKGAHSPIITARPSDYIILKKLLCFDNELQNRRKNLEKNYFILLI